MRLCMASYCLLSKPAYCATCKRLPGWKIKEAESEQNMSEQQQKNRKAPRGTPTKAAVSDRLEIKPEDIDPHHDWTRLNAHGVMNVDFEERVDFRRLHRYRLGRARQ